jgi:hypothetical protein
VKVNIYIINKKTSMKNRKRGTAWKQDTSSGVEVKIEAIM